MKKHKAILRNADYFGFDPIYFNFPCVIDFTRFGDKDYIETDLLKTTHIEFPTDDHYYKVFVCCNEPSSSTNREHNKVIILNSYQYDMILTTEEEIIQNCDNAFFFPYGGTWLNKKKDNHQDSLGEYNDSILQKIVDKKFNVSFLTTSHLGKPGYSLRQNVWKNKEKIKIPSVFYSSTRFKTDGNSAVGLGRFSDTLHDGLLPNDDKIHLFDSQFSIAIESSRENSYFTEKLIDCLLTKTVPIYWGCPNIGDFFDIRGIIHVKSFEELIEKINKIDETTYQSMISYIEYNFEKAKEYGRSFFKRIQEKVEENYNFQLQQDDILWSIGILTLPNRKEELDKLLWMLDYTMPFGYKHRIEILINEDNGEKSVGQKRNEILQKAKGRYISFIDDDDMVQSTYLPKICNALNKNLYDGIGFWGLYYVSGKPIMTFNHANSNNGHFKNDGKQYRPLNHLNPVRTKIARQIGFPDKNFAEDADYCDRLLESRLIKEEFVFDEIMYHYLFDPQKTETQK